MVSDSAGEGGEKDGLSLCPIARLCCQGCCLMQGTCTAEPSQPLAGGLRELRRPSSSAEQGPGEDAKTPQSPSPLLRLAASVQEEGACLSVRPGCGGEGPCPRSRKALSSRGTRCPCRCRLPSPELSRNGGAVCWSTRFLLETWKSRWPARASWDASELAARFWRTVRICVSYKPFLLQEEEEILV